jgi:hypothetical protein
MKFAMIEMKIALVNILKNFEIHPSVNTPKTLKVVEAVVKSFLYNIMSFIVLKILILA